MTRKIPSDNTATFFLCAVQNEDSFWENCSKFACSSWGFCSAAHWLQFVLFVNVLVHIAVQQHERSGEENQRKKNVAVLKLSEKFVGLCESWSPKGLVTNKNMLKCIVWCFEKCWKWTILRRTFIKIAFWTI